MKVLILLDRQDGLKKEEAIWFSSIVPFVSKINVISALPEKRSKEAFISFSQDFWQEYGNEDFLFISMGGSSRVFHTDFEASPWMYYCLERDGKVYKIISLPSSYKFLSRENLVLVSASHAQHFIMSCLERQKEFSKVLVFQNGDIKIWNLGIFPDLKINILGSDEVERILDIKGEISIDLETSGLFFYKNSILTVSIFDGREAYVFLYFDKTAEVLKKFLKENVDVLIGANLKFDVLFLYWNLRLKELLDKRWIDPLLMNTILDNSSVNDIGLKTLASKFLNSIDYSFYFLSKIDKELRWNKIHEYVLLNFGNLKRLEDFLKYSAFDSYWAWELSKYLEKKFDSDMWVLYDKLMEEVSKLLTEISFRGVKVDWDLLAERERLAQQELKRLENEIREKTGITNPNSVSQLRDFLKENFKKILMTKKGNIKIDTETLNRLREEYKDERLALLVNYKALRHLYSTFLKKKLRDYADKNSYLHPEYNQSSTISGRLSSSNPNLQQLPGVSVNIKSQNLSETYRKVWNVKEFIKAEDGFKIVEVDFNQAELRGGAFITQERRMLYGFRVGEDLYKLLGEKIYKKPKEEITKEERVLLKRLLLGIMYGLTEQGVMSLFKISRKEASEILKNTFELFPNLKKLRSKIANLFSEDRKEVFIVAPTRQRLLLEKSGWLSDKKWFMDNVYKKSFNSAINFPIQSMTSDWMLRFALRIKKDFPEIRILNLVHDSVLIEMREDLLDSFLRKLVSDYRYYLLEDEIFEVMIKRFLKFLLLDFPIIDIPPLKYEVKVGDNWGNCEEIEIKYVENNLPSWDEGVKIIVPVKKSEKDKRILGDWVLVKEVGVLVKEDFYKKLPNECIVFNKGLDLIYKEAKHYGT